MSCATVLEAVIAVLDSLRISYHVTGGLASGFYGEPRLIKADFHVGEDVPG